MRTLAEDGESQIKTLDQLLRQRSIDAEQCGILAFPRSRHSVTDYEPISGYTLNQFVEGAARELIRRGFSSKDPEAVEVVIGICAPTDLDYIVTIFACIRLGYVPFLLSPRLSPSAVCTLLNDQNCDSLIFAPDYKAFKANERSLCSFNLQPMPKRSEYESSQLAEDHFVQGDAGHVDRKIPQRCILLHSSGSTGLPKVIDIDDKKLMAVATYAQDGTAFITAPFSHSFGLLSYMQAIHKRKTIYAMNGHLPQTHDTLTDAIKAANPEIIWTVPYALKLLSEKPEGVAALKNCRFVSSAGSKLPDEIGDMLTEAGVHIGMQFGSTETGLILSSAYRPHGDKAWNYLRPPPHAAAFIQFQKAADGLYECVVLDGHRGKTASNSDNPPYSWRTNDLFIPHATIPNAWKFIGRMDDRITLLNGEKVLPLAIEGRIKQHHLVKEAVVFGIDREVPGLLLFRALGTEHLNDNEFLQEVWPLIDEANSRSEAFAQIGKDYVAIMAEDVDCPTTDKSSIKRGQIYRDFANIIDNVYHSISHHKAESLHLTLPQLQAWIMRCLAEMGHEIQDVNTDLFSAGIDSLKATQIRSRILRHIDLGGHESKCTPMLVYDTGTPAKLAYKLHQIRAGTQQLENEDELRLMEALIEENSSFGGRQSKEPKSPHSEQGIVVILTGATGSLGSHILNSLVHAQNVTTIYCFVRSKDNKYQSPAKRLEQASTLQGIVTSSTKIITLAIDMSSSNLGLDNTNVEALRSSVTHIIHCAWHVNFAVPLSSFREDLQALNWLLRLSIESDRDAYLLFCSSISVAQSTKRPANIASQPIPQLSDAAPTGYGRSKLVGERIVQAAVENGARASILRIGQIVPALDPEMPKLWKLDEAVPLILQSSKSSSTGCLPLLDPTRDSCRWFPVDWLAQTILDLAGVSTELVAGRPLQLVYNIMNPRGFSWQNHLLPALREEGLVFQQVSWDEWLRKLAASSDDFEINPSKKLLDFWTRQSSDSGGITFDTSAAESASEHMQNMPRLDEGAYISQIVGAWRDAHAL